MLTSGSSPWSCHSQDFWWLTPLFLPYSLPSSRRLSSTLCRAWAIVSMRVPGGAGQGERAGKWRLDARSQGIGMDKLKSLQWRWPFWDKQIQEMKIEGEGEPIELQHEVLSHLLSLSNRNWFTQGICLFCDHIYWCLVGGRGRLYGSVVLRIKPGPSA